MDLNLTVRNLEARTGGIVFSVPARTRCLQCRAWFDVHLLVATEQGRSLLGGTVITAQVASRTCPTCEGKDQEKVRLAAKVRGGWA